MINIDINWYVLKILINYIITYLYHIHTYYISIYISTHMRHKPYTYPSFLQLHQAQAKRYLEALNEQLQQEREQLIPAFDG